MISPNRCWRPHTHCQIKPLVPTGAHWCPLVPVNTFEYRHPLSQVLTFRHQVLTFFLGHFGVGDRPVQTRTGAHGHTHFGVGDRPVQTGTGAAAHTHIDKVHHRLGEMLFWHLALFPSNKRKRKPLQQTTCLADKTNHPVEGLSLNRSQCGSCSTKYDTPAGT